MEKEKNSTDIINVQTPLLQPNGTHQQIHQPINNNHNNEQQQQQQHQVDHKQQENVANVVVVVADVDGEEEDTQLDKTLKKLEFYLRFLGFDQTTPLRFILSWIVFLIVGVAVPVLIIELTHCLDCEDYQVKDFEYEILTSHLLLGGVSLICVAYNINKRGFRKFLFVDRYRGHTSRFKDQYIKKIKVNLSLRFVLILSAFWVFMFMKLGCYCNIYSLMILDSVFVGKLFNYELVIRVYVLLLQDRYNILMSIFLDFVFRFV